MADYTASTFNRILKENLDEAARNDVDEGTIARILLEHRDAIKCKGLDCHTGLSTIPFEQADES